APPLPRGARLRRRARPPDRRPRRRPLRLRQPRLPGGDGLGLDPGPPGPGGGRGRPGRPPGRPGRGGRRPGHRRGRVRRGHRGRQGRPGPVRAGRALARGRHRLAGHHLRPRPGGGRRRGRGHRGAAAGPGPGQLRALRPRPRPPRPPPGGPGPPRPRCRPGRRRHPGPGPPLMGRQPLLGLTLPQFTERPEAALEAAVDARRLGFAGGFVFDHLWPLGAPQRPALECWTLLAGGAAGAPGGRVGGPPRGGRGGPGTPQGGARENRVFRVGTLVTRAGLRSPGLVARMAGTVGQVAGAPPIIGVGRGDRANRAENLAYGLPFGDPGERAAALEATVAALRGLLTGDPAPEVWGGGAGPGAHELAGRLADGWNGWALTPEELAAGLAAARVAAE